MKKILRFYCVRKNTMPPFFLRKKVTGNSKWQFLHVIELDKTKRVCPIFIFLSKGELS